ncbi:polysaccharide deacetylase family protein [bacterium]|nr:polysaccharide deacetylase family protein [bacterium]
MHRTNRAPRPPGHGRRRFVAAVPVMLVAILALAAGCGDDDRPAPAGSLYELDPPELGLESVTSAGPGVPVLCYHYFRSGFDPGYLARVLGSVLFGMPALGPREFWTTPIGEFEKHLKHFRDTGTRVMTLDEVADLVETGRPLPPRAVVLTIDDADRSVYELAWPLLREYGVRAHLFVPTGHVGSDWADLDVCSWEELREMAASGTIILGSHTRDLHYKIGTRKGLEPVFWNPQEIDGERRAATLADVTAHRRQGDLAWPPAATAVLSGPWGPVAADLLASRGDIATARTDARWLAWPYGFANGDLDSIARAVGFRGTVSLEPRPFAATDSLLHTGRFTLTAKSTVGMLDEIMRRSAELSPTP